MTSVSVIIPTRNRSSLLRTTLRSVLWQQGVDLEVIVVDEASTDDTPDVVAGLGDPRVAMVRHDAPQGLSAARNRGAERATREWVGFVDDDDVWAPEKLALQTAAADHDLRDWVYVGTVNVGSGLEIVSWGPPPSPAEVVAALPRYNPIPGGGSNVILRRRSLEVVGYFDERLPACEDWEMWLRLARSGPPAAVRRPLMGYRLHGGSMSLDTERIRRGIRLLEQAHGTTVDWGRLHRWLAESSLRADQHARALTHFVRAAARGQARGVATDLAAILGRKVAGRRARQRTRGKDAWFAEASVWLEKLGTPTTDVGQDPV